MASLKRKRTPNSSRPSKSSRKAKSLSKLEALPPEILQQIFFHSENVWLTQASPVISRKLSSDHVCEEFCKRVFIHHAEKWRKGEELEYKSRVRVMDSKFFTWPFFLRLLDHLPRDHGDGIFRYAAPLLADIDRVAKLQRKPYPYDQADKVRALRRAIPGSCQVFWIDDDSRRTKIVEAFKWRISQLRIMLLRSKIPDKLLIPPFTPDKIDFLHVLLCVVKLKIATPSLTTNAIKTAIRAKEHHLVWILLKSAKNEDATFEELLRTAVLEGDCDEDIVQMLTDEWIFHLHKCCGCRVHKAFNRNCHTCTTPRWNDTCGHPVRWNESVDLLDRVLWNWADQEKKNKNWKGEWFETNLKRLCQEDDPITAKEYLATRASNRQG